VTSTGAVSLKPKLNSHSLQETRRDESWTYRTALPDKAQSHLAKLYIGQNREQW